MWKKIKLKIFQRTKSKKIVFFVIADAILISLSCYLGFYLRFDGNIPAVYHAETYFFILLTAPIVIFIFAIERLYAFTWAFISIREIIRIFTGTIFGMSAVSVVLFLLKDTEYFVGFPRSVIFITATMIFLFVSALRFAKRLYFHEFRMDLPFDGKKLLIFGAGEAGEQILRHIQMHQTHFPVGFVDDNRMKHGTLLHGVKVFGAKECIPTIAKKHVIDELIIAAPNAPRNVIRHAVQLAREAGIEKIKILPSTAQILDEKVSLNQVREVSIEDLLGRAPVKIDTKSIENFIAGKIVLVTGGAGSIGSNLCRQILKFKPNRLISIDQNETGSFHLERELSAEFPNVSKTFIVGDICDEQKINSVFSACQPNIVFHAAAYKHVPLMETHPDEAIRNNVFGTLNIGRAAINHHTEKFVMISTDKAINPTSIMGASKRVGEMIAVWLNKQNSTRFCAVRFGNVLDSQGNVVGIFEKQIKKGGPVEVTHPDMKRYFMVTSEACLLVMQAGTIGAGGEVFVLDMGEPIKIVDLAKEMIKLAGYEPDVDIPIVYTGIRQGEKMFEEIITDSEMPTKHEKIFISRLNGTDDEKLAQGLIAFKAILQGSRDKSELIARLAELVPTLQIKK
ncbi:MAG: nucleoside-diphosphate sugar epimerase/dehydratase [Parcubacteria group bacterium]